MFDEKKSMWKKKGFYVSVCTAMICLMAIGVVYSRMEHQENAKQVADTNQQQSPSSQILDENSNTDGSKEAASVGNSLDETLQAAKEKNADTSSDATVEEDDILIGLEEEVSLTVTPKPTPDQTKASEKSQTKQETETIHFDEEKGLLWPVDGEVLMKFDMTGATYFKTLAQYRANPAVILSVKEGTKVKASTKGTVLSVKKKDETGMTVTVDIGDHYKVIYGQLKDVTVKKGSSVKEGDVIGTVASPTQFYQQEGDNLYFQVKKNNEPIDPMLLLR